MLGEDGHSDRRRDRQALPDLDGVPVRREVDAERRRPDDGAEPGSEPGRTDRIGLGQHDHELLTAVARDGVDLADLGSHAARELDQHRVADLVPVLVVDRLETVEVEHQQARAAC